MQPRPHMEVGVMRTGAWERSMGTYGRRLRGEHEAAGANRVAGTGPAAVPRKGPGHVAFAQPGPPLSATSDDGSKSLHPSQVTRLALTCTYGRAKEGVHVGPAMGTNRSERVRGAGGRE